MDSRSVMCSGWSNVPTLKYFKLREDAIPPSKQHHQDAGFDLATPHDITLYPHTTTIIKTGLALQFPFNTYGRIVERSSTSLRCIRVGGGVVDNNYEGEVTIIYNMCL